MVDHGSGWERDRDAGRTGYSPHPTPEPDLDRTHRILRMIVDDTRGQLERLGEPVAALDGWPYTAEALLRRTLARTEPYAAPAGSYLPSPARSRSRAPAAAAGIVEDSAGTATGATEIGDCRGGAARAGDRRQ
ncbi:hypothetical protein BX266_7511 [Streptomyces sp. TLI_171]|nr:hypothetical protein BX266_7511 [Streptomyces sp. TLI_171]